MDALDRPARWERCLARPGAGLCALPGETGRYGVFPGADKRRRPLAKLDQDALDIALRAGRIEVVDGGYRLSREGVSALRRDGSGEAGFQAQHRQRVARHVTGADGKVHEVEANALESPLARYRASLTASQLQAGEIFHRDYVRSSLMASITRNWAIDAPVRGQGGAPCGPEDASLSRLAAKDRVLDALAAVGTSLEPVLMAVLVREESLAALERRFGWGVRSGRVVLGLALDALARHYRLSV